MHRAAASTVVLFFLTLQVLEFHTRTYYTRVARFPMGLLATVPSSLLAPFTRSLFPSLFLSLYFPLSFHAKGTPYCFTKRDQFLFHSISLSAAYYMRFLPFVRSNDCSHGQTFEPDSPHASNSDAREDGGEGPIGLARIRSNGEERMTEKKRAIQ